MRHPNQKTYKLEFNHYRKSLWIECWEYTSQMNCVYHAMLKLIDEERELKPPTEPYTDLVIFMKTHFCCSQTEWIRDFKLSKSNTKSPNYKSDWHLKEDILDDILLSGYIYNLCNTPALGYGDETIDIYLIYKPYSPPTIL